MHMNTNNATNDIRIVRRFQGFSVQRLLGSTANPDDKVWVTVEEDLTESEARNIAGLPPRGHRAAPLSLEGSSSECIGCGGRVVARANAHGYTVWSHRKAGR
jgi:hypothetical protein